MPGHLAAIRAAATAAYVTWNSHRTGAQPAPWQHVEIKRALIAESDGKCVYCESYLRHVAFGDVEHRKPKTRFPESVLEWGNLGLACQVCNTNNNNRRELIERRDQVVKDAERGLDSAQRARPLHVEIMRRSVRDSRSQTDEYFACFLAAWEAHEERRRSSTR